MLRYRLFPFIFQTCNSTCNFLFKLDFWYDFRPFLCSNGSLLDTRGDANFYSPCPSDTCKLKCVPEEGPRCPNWFPRALRSLQMWPKWYQKWDKTKCKAGALSDSRFMIVAACAELVDMILGLVLQLNLKQNWTFLHVQTPWNISPVWGAFL